ncbi:hypothetical protein HanIR_Chr04g0174751 [Helianthus annuus]|nr:hypothetical protein HanIR_Chr04g0174751 [Helianthus annuus]
MAEMFDEKENEFIERLNRYGWYHMSMYEQDDKKIWTLRLERFACQKDETLKEMERRFDYLVDKLKMFGIKLTDTEKISKFADALPAKWDDVLKKLKQEPKFSKLHPSDFINKLQKHSYENSDKKKILMNKIKENLDKLNLGNLNKINLDVITEIDRRICMCFAAKQNMKYDFKRGCYIDANLNPLDFVKIVCAGIYKTEIKKMSNNEESVKNESSSSESVCIKCDNLKTENDKLLKDAESLTSEVKKLEDKKQADIKQILMFQEICEKLKIENDKLLSNFNSLTLKNQKLKENAKVFEEKIKSFEFDKSRIEKDFQDQIKILEDGRNVFSQNNIEKQKIINSHLQKIIKLEKEGECARKKIKELEEKESKSKNEDFWIKLENKNLKANETKF